MAALGEFLSGSQPPALGPTSDLCQWQLSTPCGCSHSPIADVVAHPECVFRMGRPCFSTYSFLVDARFAPTMSQGIVSMTPSVRRAVRDPGALSLLTEVWLRQLVAHLV
jgi:hypothetical protein